MELRGDRQTTTPRRQSLTHIEQKQTAHQIVSHLSLKQMRTSQMLKYQLYLTSIDVCVKQVQNMTR